MLDEEDGGLFMLLGRTLLKVSPEIKRFLLVRGCLLVRYLTQCEENDHIITEPEIIVEIK